jgi:alkanesulfonate monooxygenase SsuD/methylene tetrahydromethanopterin reductase-like flavin-dependent oxidoreductase (luciferase family)
VIARSTAFPNSPKAQVVKQIAQLIARGGRRVVVENADWRTMLAFAAFAQARAAAGLPPSRHVGRLIEVACARDEDTAIRRAAPYLLAKYAAYLSWGIPGITLNPGASPEAQLRRLAADRFALGSPDQVVEALLAQHRAGVTHATMRVSWPGMPQDDILAGIELLGRAVLPEVRRRVAVGG